MNSGKLDVVLVSLKIDLNRLGCRARSESKELKYLSRLSFISFLSSARNSRYFCVSWHEVNFFDFARTEGGVPFPLIFLVGI